MSWFQRNDLNFESHSNDEANLAVSRLSCPTIVFCSDIKELGSVSHQLAEGRQQSLHRTLVLRYFPKAVGRLVIANPVCNITLRPKKIDLRC